MCIRDRVYRTLEKEDVIKIINLQIEEINKNLADWNIKVSYTEASLNGW